MRISISPQPLYGGYWFAIVTFTQLTTCAVNGVARQVHSLNEQMMLLFRMIMQYSIFVKLWRGHWTINDSWCDSSSSSKATLTELPSIYCFLAQDAFFKHAQGDCIGVELLIDLDKVHAFEFRLDFYWLDTNICVSSPTSKHMPLSLLHVQLRLMCTKSIKHSRRYILSCEYVLPWLCHICLYNI